MIGVEKSSPYRKLLLDMINAINQVVPLKEENQVLIVMKLNTEQKIGKWIEWIRQRLSGENNLNATETEIVRAAVKIDKGIL